MARILLVNDEADLVEICGVVLREARHEVEALVDGRRALETAVRMRPELIIIDWILGQTSAEEVLPKLRLHPETAHAPILAVSALPDGAMRARLYGADAFLGKPFTAEALLRSVQDLLEAKAARVGA